MVDTQYFKDYRKSINARPRYFMTPDGMEIRQVEMISSKKARMNYKGKRIIGTIVENRFVVNG